MNPLIDWYLDNLEARVLALEARLVRANKVGQVEKEEAEQSNKVESDDDAAIEVNNIKKKDTASLFTHKEWYELDDPEAIVRGLSEALKLERDSSGYVRIKAKLGEAFTFQQLASFIDVIHRIRTRLKNWDRVVSCILAAIKAHTAQDQSMNSLLIKLGDSVREMIRKSENDSNITAEARLLRKIIDAIPKEIPEREETIKQVALVLAELPSPSIRAAAVDLVAMSYDENLVKHVSQIAFLTDGHRLVEDALRRIAESDDPVRKRNVGYVLVSQM